MTQTSALILLLLLVAALFAWDVFRVWQRTHIRINPQTGKSEPVPHVERTGRFWIEIGLRLLGSIVGLALAWKLLGR